MLIVTLLENGTTATATKLPRESCPPKLTNLNKENITHKINIKAQHNPDSSGQLFSKDGREWLYDHYKINTAHMSDSSKTEQKQPMLKKEKYYLWNFSSLDMWKNVLLSNETKNKLFGNQEQHHVLYKASHHPTQQRSMVSNCYLLSSLYVPITKTNLTSHLKKKQKHE